MEQKEISIEQWHEIALRAEKRGEHIPLKFSVNGISMTPLIRKDKDRVAILPRVGQVKRGDIVLFRRKTARASYILHRVYRVEEDGALTLGDGNLSTDGWVRLSDILGIAVGLERDGRWLDLESMPLRLWGRLWMLLLPVRGKLIAFYLWAKKAPSGGKIQGR